MKKLLLLAAFAFFATPAFAQTAVLTQAGGNQTGSITQTGSSSNQAYVDQFTDNGGPQTATVSQDGVNNYANVDMDETGTGNNTPASFATLTQEGNDNVMWQRTYAPTSNQNLGVTAAQDGDRNYGNQFIDTGYLERLTLDQVGNDNQSTQYLNGGGYNFGDVIQHGNVNFASQTLVGFNEGAGADEVSTEQIGDNNVAYQSATGGAFNNPTPPDEQNTAIIDQFGSGNYANQTGNGTGYYTRLYQEGNSNVGTVSSVGDYNYLNIHSSHGGYVSAAQLGDNNEVVGLGGSGTEATVLNGSSLTLAQTGNLNDAFVGMSTGGSATVTQTGDSNVGTVDQH